MAPEVEVKVSAIGDGRWTVTIDPDEVSTGTEVKVAGTETVVVPPLEVGTPETVVDWATETEVVPPDEVSSVTYETDSMVDDET